MGLLFCLTDDIIVIMDLKYDWENDIEPYLGLIQDVKGGFTAAKRGVIELENGDKIFVKISTDEKTHNWLKKEIKVYKKLHAVNYKYAAKLLSHSKNHHGMAIEYLENASFDNVWDQDKINAVMLARDELQNYKDLFTGDIDFKSDDIEKAEDIWNRILIPGNLDIINYKLAKLGFDLDFTSNQIVGFKTLHDDWLIEENCLVHQDIRADNFGYDQVAKTGKLIDWNWLSISDNSLDITPLFINMHISGLDPYKMHPEKYDEKMIVYLIGFWMDCILYGDEDSSPREWSSRVAQAKNLEVCLELLNMQSDTAQIL
jgi:hypothetical protein